MCIRDRDYTLLHLEGKKLVVAPREPRNFYRTPGSSSEDLPSFPDWHFFTVKASSIEGFQNKYDN